MKKKSKESRSPYMPTGLPKSIRKDPPVKPSQKKSPYEA